MAEQEPRDLEQEDKAVAESIRLFKEAQYFDSNFISAMYHEGEMQRRRANFIDALKLFSKVLE
jgi:hypothetical protein